MSAQGLQVALAGGRPVHSTVSLIPEATKAQALSCAVRVASCAVPPAAERHEVLPWKETQTSHSYRNDDSIA